MRLPYGGSLEWRSQELYLKLSPGVLAVYRKVARLLSVRLGTQLKVGHAYIAVLNGCDDKVFGPVSENWCDQFTSPEVIDSLARYLEPSLQDLLTSSWPILWRGICLDDAQIGPT